MSAPLQGTHVAAGATFAEVAGVPVVHHYGDAAAEYRAVREAVGVVDRADLAQLRLWGKDPVKMLHGLVTNDLAGAPPGQGVYAAMLTPKGRMIAELRAFTRPLAGGTELLVDLPREALEGTRAHLGKFVPPMFARWGEAETAALGVYGPNAAELVRRALEAEPPGPAEDAFVDVEWQGHRALVARTAYAGGEEGFDLFLPAGAVSPLWEVLLSRGDELGARPVGHAALDVLRIEAGRPRYGRELSEETIPTEAYESTGLMARAVSFAKGCYTGQEVIVRIAHRGHVNRHLRGLLLGEAPEPAARTPLLHPESGKEVGWTTSAAVSPLVGQTVALAYLRREVEPGARVRLGAPEGPEALVADLPFRGAGEAP